MDGGDFASTMDMVGVDWEVFKDAFAPPPPTRRTKAWERAPVPAHALRFQGQKIWKKVGVKPNNGLDDKENHNHEAAQLELEKGGMGARKRARVLGGKNKENIGAALWKEGGEEEGVGIFGMDSQSPKKARMSLGVGDMDAFVVPRKRTNANHLITPRKPLRKIPFNDQSQTMNVLRSSVEKSARIPLIEDDKILDLPKDTQSPVKKSPQKVPLNDLDLEETAVPGTPAQNPARRRKSLRRSTRRLTRGTSTEPTPTTPAEDAFSGTSQIPIVEPRVSDIVAEAQRPVVISENSDVILESTFNADPVVNLETTKTYSDLSSPSEPDSNISKALAGSTVQQLMEGLGETGAPNIHNESLGDCSTTNRLEGPLASDDVQPNTPANERRTQTPIQSLEIQPPILVSIESSATTEAVSPTKMSGTPRRKRKTPQRRGTRRSTRTRASSVPPEDQTSLKPVTTIPMKSRALHSFGSPIKSRGRDVPSKESIAPALEAVESVTRSHEDQAPALIEDNAAINIEVGPLETTAEVLQPLTGHQEENMSDMQVMEASHVLNPDVPRPDDLPLSEELTVENSELVSEQEAAAAVANIPTTDVQTYQMDLEICEAEDTAAATNSHQDDEESIDSSLGSEEEFSPVEDTTQLILGLKSDEAPERSVDSVEALEPISVAISTTLDNSTDEAAEELPETSTPNPSTTELVEAISENAPAASYDQDDTDMLRNFLTRVKANKAAKAETAIPKRKRSLPHSPIHLPLGSVDSQISPSDEFDVSLPAASVTKRNKLEPSAEEEDLTEPKSIRRSGRTRLPIKAAPLAAPSFIPVRRLGQDGDSTVTLRRNEEKELAALTRVNTRKNKGGALHPADVLAKKQEKEDPASRQRALKEVFDEKVLKQKKGKGKNGKSVVWAEELAQFQNVEGKKVEMLIEREREEKEAVLQPAVEEKKSKVKVGMRSKIALGMAANGTPAPKRRKGRS